MQILKKRRIQGFTLIELLIVIAIIAIIAAVAFVALDPLTRFQDARDSSRWADVSAIAAAIRVDQVDNGGSYIAAVATTTQGTTYMIGTGGTACVTAGANVSSCDQTITASTDCVDLTGLVDEGYLGNVPISPNGDGTWDATETGYTLVRATSTVTIAACESENSTASEITISR